MAIVDEAKAGLKPVIPQRMMDVVVVEMTDVPGVCNLKFRTPSAQFVNRLTIADKAELEAVYKWAGADFNDALTQMKLMLPANPRGK